MLYFSAFPLKDMSTSAFTTSHLLLTFLALFLMNAEGNQSNLSPFLILPLAGGIFEAPHVSAAVTLLVFVLMISGPNFCVAVFRGLPKFLLHLVQNFQHVCIFFSPLIC